jgi:signal transduction histidine kinase
VARIGWSSLGNYLFGLVPFVMVWLVLVVWLVSLLHSRASWSEESDTAIVREWLDETRSFRRTLPELVREYVQVRAEVKAGVVLPERAVEKRDELDEQLKSMTEPTRAYENKLPGFPVIYELKVVLRSNIKGSIDGETIEWVNPTPRPRQQNQSRVQSLVYRPFGDADDRAEIRCEYQMHAFNKLQGREQERRRESLVAGAVLVAATLIAGVFVYRFLRHELKRETERLQRQLDAANLELRADEAEKTALEVKSQLYAGIGIMAGSYAHNIKNLLVRPNDLLRRCIDAENGNTAQTVMLTEVQATLGTVTERLQQILRTVRRDPSQAEKTPIDLAKLVREMAATWGDTARDKWKVNVTAEVAEENLIVQADVSHLHQAVENLLFNARDATFEMRNHLRENARLTTGDNRKQKLLESAAWKGEVRLRAARDGKHVVLEVTDNGIGMTPEVREHCLETHFSTKRDNALYEGYSAGMGLGLSFVAMVFEHHGATLEIDSAPLKGTTFRARFAAS